LPRILSPNILWGEKKRKESIGKRGREEKEKKKKKKEGGGGREFLDRIFLWPRGGKGLKKKREKKKKRKKREKEERDANVARSVGFTA